MRDCTRWLLRTIIFWPIVLSVNLVSGAYVTTKLGLELGVIVTVAVVTVAYAIVTAVGRCFGRDPGRRS